MDGIASAWTQAPALTRQNTPKRIGLRAGSRSVVWALHSGTGRCGPLELSTVPHVENVVLAPFQVH
jgi:hypothetical protein